MDLWDLGDAQLRQLMEDLCLEVAHWGIECAPHGNHCWVTWGLQQEMGIPMWMTRGSPSWEGGDGNPEDNHLDPLPHQPDEDLGHLINTLATRLWLGTPWINTFSSKATLGKMEMSFEQWYLEVQCVKDHQLESVVWESIVRLLKGQQWIWPGTWVLPPAWPIFYKS